ncbi:MAG: hypothetical protein A3F09_03715 [Chlamydiae bacterium RIFCSPHIGHO2_12_FULL_49_11]|nr:MAG: hypothetical protein A3F09_03715 [Chlamydiae bacterium RIFCSPHIGHO2_12_FULL_49_11]
MKTVWIIRSALKQEKPERLLRLIRSKFFEKKEIGIVVEGEKAALWLDAFLWRKPPELFLPHAIDDLRAPIVITEKAEILSKKEMILINLGTKTLENFSASEIYEFESENGGGMEKGRLLCYKNSQWILADFLG